MQTQLPTETQPLSTAPQKFDEGPDVFFLPPKPNELGLAVTSVLNRGLQVPSSTSISESEFDYPAELRRFDVSPEHWQRFTETVRLGIHVFCTQFITMIGHDPDALAVGGVIVGILGAVPAFFLRTNTIKEQERHLDASLENSPGEQLARHLSHWNDSFFRPKGVLVRLDLIGGNWNYLERTPGLTPTITDKCKPEDIAHRLARIVVILLEI